MYLTPDLTATNPMYKRDSDLRLVIVQDQKLEFLDSPIYPDTLQISLLGTVNITLVKFLDWAIREDDIDYATMSRMKLIDPTFDKVIVKSITMVKSWSQNYRVQMSYQRVLPIESKLALEPTNEILNITPELMDDLIRTVRYHDDLLTPVDDIHSIHTKSPLLLEADPRKERPENVIRNEFHNINTTTKIHVIHPRGGAYYRDSLMVERVDPDVEDPTVSIPENILVEGVDYQVDGCDFHRTRITANTSGVYRHILFIKDLVGEVKITYHAYGGDVVLDDIRAHNESINNILKYILDSQLVTEETLVNAKAMVTMRSRIAKLEENMRALALTGSPSGGDCTTGSTLVKKIMSVDNALHWYTIASLYKVDGSDDIFTSDVMKLRLQSLYTKFSFLATINVNIDHATTKLDVSCESATYPKGYIPFEDYSQIEQIIRPQFRIIWNANTVEGSGIYLQLGFRLKGIIEETFAIEDMSGKQSAWKLLSTVSEASAPEDNLVTLPAANHIWDTLNPNSAQATHIVPFPDGHLVWAGEEALNRPDSGWKNFELVHLLEKDTDITKLRSLRLDLEERNGSRFPVKIEFIPGSDKLAGSISFNYNGLPAYINALVERNTLTSDIRIRINADITAGPSANQLSLKQVLAFF